MATVWFIGFLFTLGLTYDEFDGPYYVNLLLAFLLAVLWPVRLGLIVKRRLTAREPKEERNG